MKNLFIISFLLLALSSCIKVQDINTECALNADPQLTSTTYTITSYGSTVRLSISNFTTGKEFVVVSPGGDSLVFDHYSDYYIEIPISGPSDTGAYYIFARDYTNKCKSKDVYFTVTGGGAQLTCNLTADYFSLINGSSYYAGTSSGQSYTNYYSASWYTSYGTVNVKFGKVYTGTGSTNYSITQTSPSNMGDTQCNITYSNSSYTYTATAGNVLVNYNSGTGYYNVKLCDITWLRNDNNYYYGGSGWLRYY